MITLHRRKTHSLGEFPPIRALFRNHYRRTRCLYQAEALAQSDSTSAMHMDAKTSPITDDGAVEYPFNVGLNAMRGWHLDDDEMGRELPLQRAKASDGVHQPRFIALPSRYICRARHRNSHCLSACRTSHSFNHCILFFSSCGAHYFQHEVYFRNYRLSAGRDGFGPWFCPADLAWRECCRHMEPIQGPVEESHQDNSQV